MKIQDIRNYINTNAPAKRETEQAKGSYRKYDTVEISGKGKGKEGNIITPYTKDVKTASHKAVSETDKKRLENIRQQVKAGTYRVPAEAIADALLSYKTNKK